MRLEIRWSKQQVIMYVEQAVFLITFNYSTELTSEPSELLFRGSVGDNLISLDSGGTRRQWYSIELLNCNTIGHIRSSHTIPDCLQNVPQILIFCLFL